MKISWPEHQSNREVLDMVHGWKQKLDEHPRQRQLRSESLLRTVLEGRMEGTRTRERQNATMIDEWRATTWNTIIEKKFMIEKTGVIGGLNLPEKAQHSREREWEGFSRSYHFSDSKQEVKVIWQKAPHGGPIPRLGVTPGGRKLYHWIPGVGFPISVP